MPKAFNASLFVKQQLDYRKANCTNAESVLKHSLTQNSHSSRLKH